MKTKKAQVQNMETVAVVIIIIILIIFGIVYATNQKKTSLEGEVQRLKDIDVMKLTTNIINMDFVRCSQLEANLETCVDYHKILALKDETTKDKNYEYFYHLFGDTEIKLIILKNLTNTELDTENITIYEAQETENRTKIPINTPVTVKEIVTDVNYFAIMEVTVFR